MVNVDVSPSVILGVGLIGAGVSLWQIRRARPWMSKDYDVVVSCISLLVGGILIFQGWRLDPLLLFGQLMTTGAAVSFAIEALRLRSVVYENEEKAALRGVTNRDGPSGSGSGGASFQLPPPEAQWGEPGQPAEGAWAEGRQWSSSSSGYSQQDQGLYTYSDQGPPSSSGYYAGGQQAGQYDYEGQAGEGWQYVEADYLPSEVEFPAPGQGDFSGEGGGSGGFTGGSEAPAQGMFGDDWE